MDKAALWQSVREAALENAEGKCENCGCDAIERLTIHHIIRRSHAPSLKYFIPNLKVLCRACHKKVEKEMNLRLREMHILMHKPHALPAPMIIHVKRFKVK